MNADEVDLVGRLKDAALPRPEAYERARATLRAAMAEPEPVARPRGRSRWTKVGIGVGIGAVAAAAAIALAVTSASPSAPTTGTASKAPTVGSPLVSLAALVEATNGSLPGNASLVIRDQAIGTRAPDVLYALYTDGGAIYETDTESALPKAIAGHANLAEPVDARQVAAARYAATGDLATARTRMINATPNSFALGQSPAARRAAWKRALAKALPVLRAKGIKTTPKEPTGKALQGEIDNSLWNNSFSALTEGGGNPEIRAGVLRLISTIPEVTIAHTTTGVVPTLTLTAGPALFGGGARQVLTINAKTGSPIRSVVSGPGMPTSVETYTVSRVTLADIEHGKF